MIVRPPSVLTIILLLLLSHHLRAREANVEVLENFRETTVNEYRLVHKYSRLVQVNNRNGEVFNPLTIHYSNSIRISDIKVQIEDVRGKVIRVIKKKEISEESAISGGSFYEDDMMKLIPVTHNNYPYRIRYSYTVSAQEYMSLAFWSPYLRSNIPVRHARLRIRVPESYPMKIYDHLIFRSEQKLPDGSMEFTWELRDLKKFEPEHYSPHFRDMSPIVHVVPDNFKYGTTGNQASWEAFGRWEKELNQGRQELPIEEKARIDALLESVDDDTEKIRLLYHYLQDNTRYIYVGLDIGGLQTYPASYVVMNRYGDCKALSNYMVSMLNYAGIHSHYSLVNAGDRFEKFRDDFPSNQFNHIIVNIPRKRDTLWLECTSRSLPFAYTGSSTQGRPALLIDDEISTLASIPALREDEVTETRRYKLTALSYGHPKAKLQARLRGDSFEKFRYVGTQMQERKKKEMLYRHLGLKEDDLLSWSINDPHRDSSYLDIDVEFDANEDFSKMGDMNMYRPVVIGLPSMEKPEKRTLPVKVYTPRGLKVITELKLPAKSQIEALPSDTMINSPAGKYSRSIEVNSNIIKLTRDCFIPAQEVPLEEYEVFYDFFRSVARLEKETILYK